MADETTEQTTDETTDAPAVDEGQEESAEQEAPAVDEPEEGEQDGSKAGREAAKYRRQLRETQAERDALAEQVETLQRHAVEGLIERKGWGKPAGLWASGASVADMLDESGAVDPGKVAAAWNRAADELGLARTSQAGMLDATQAAELNEALSGFGKGAGWHEAIQGR